jgi:recombination protein RecA
MAARAAVEALLRERKFDRTLTMPALQEEEVAPLNLESVDRGLSGGLPHGQISEIVGPVSSGRTSLLWAALGAATRRGEHVALIDTFDRFDPPTGAAAGIDLMRLLWVRGQAISRTAGALDPSWLPGVHSVGGPGTMVERTIDRALKALNLVVQSGVCTLVAIDLIDVPATAMRRVPAATWFRIAHAIEGSDTVVVILSSASVARSARGKSIQLNADGRLAKTEVQWSGTHDRSRRLMGLRSEASIGASHWATASRITVETVSVNAIPGAVDQRVSTTPSTSLRASR